MVRLVILHQLSGQCVGLPQPIDQIGGRDPDPVADNFLHGEKLLGSVVELAEFVVVTT